MATDPVLPDFLGLGALKAGTSYLDVMLRGHPQLSLPRYVKELDYFTRHYGRGPNWYAAQFPAPDGRRRGEISPQYLADELAPARIAAANRAVRLFVVLRHPVTRLESQYRHFVQETGYAGSFDRFLDEHPGAVGRSRYWPQLQHYRGVFPDGQLHVVLFEEMVATPLPVVQEVYRFLGVDGTHVPDAMDGAVNASGTPRFPRLYVRSKRISRRLYAHGAGRAVERAKALGAASVLRGANGRPAAAPRGSEVSGATRARLVAGYGDDVAALSAHLGRDLGEFWDL